MRNNGYGKLRRGGWLLFILLVVILMPNAEARAKSNQGKIGKNIAWTYQAKNKTLTISGNGYVGTNGLRIRNADNELLWLGKASGGLPMFQKIVFQEGITEIDYRFFCLEKVKSISLPKSFQSIRYCQEVMLEEMNEPYDPWSSTLKTIKVAKKNKYFKVSGGSLVSKNGKILYVVPSGKSVAKYQVSAKVTKISRYAFWGTNIGKVVLGKKVKTIGISAFKYSTIKGIQFRKGLTRIQYGAFDGCRLKDVALPSSLTVIGERAFYGCPLSELIIPAKVAKIHYEAFGHNYSLQKITIKGNTEIEEGAFYDTALYVDEQKNIVNRPVTVVLSKKMEASVSSLCDALGSLILFEVEQGNPQYYVKEGDLYTAQGVLVYQYGKEN